jgi:hypothetical protein
MTRHAIRRLAAPLAVAGVLVGAIAAWAASDATVAVTAYQASATTTSAVATCPSGSRAVGGGLAATSAHSAGQTQGNQRFGWPLDDSGSPTFISGGVARSWEAGLGFGLALGEWKVYALCSAKSDATISVETKNIAAESVFELQVACPAGSRALGGGVSQPNNSTKDNNFVEFSAPYDDTNSAISAEDGDQPRFWHALYSNDTKSTQGVRVYALCSPTSDATLEVNRFSVAKGQAGAGTATCPAGRHVTGGGVAPMSAPASLSIRNSAPANAAGSSAALSNGDTARGWTAEIENFSSQTTDFKVLAVCEGDLSTTPGTTPTPTGPTGPTGGTGTGPGGSTTQALELSVRPARVRAGKRKTFTFLVTTGGVPVDGASVSVRRRQALTAADGQAAITRKFARRGSATVTATKTGFTPATASITIRRRR